MSQGVVGQVDWHQSDALPLPVVNPRVPQSDKELVYQHATFVSFYLHHAVFSLPRVRELPGPAKVQSTVGPPFSFAAE